MTLPLLTNASLSPAWPAAAVDEQGAVRDIHIAGEAPLTLYVDRREIVTLMTLGSRPEALALGYLRNQGLVEQIDEIAAVQVDWEAGAAAVVTRRGVDLEGKLAHRIVSSGCGQGVLFGGLVERAQGIRLRPSVVRQSTLYALLERMRRRDTIYRQVGGVHGCALCAGSESLLFVEDVGRHNAVDTIAGLMWLEGVEGDDKIFYTTGRLTSEMVMKAAAMRVPILISRSSATQQGLELARRTGATLIARARGRHFLILNGSERVILDQTHTARALPATGRRDERNRPTAD